MDFTQDRILKKFEYNPETGEITRKRNNRVVTSTDQDGYIVVSDMEHGSNDRMRGARLVWVMHNGDIPDGYVVDHRNRVRTDNRLENLRLATQKDNAANASRHDDYYSSQYKGVQLDKWGRWLATIQTDGVTTLLGQYDCEKAAAYAYNLEAEKRYGEFAVLNDVPAVDPAEYMTIKNRDWFNLHRRGLPKHVCRLGADYSFRVNNETLARFKEQHRDDCIRFAEHWHLTGECLDLRTDITKYNKYQLPYNVFPCSTGFRASFILDKVRYHVGTFRTEEEAVVALRKRQDEVGYERKN